MDKKLLNVDNITECRMLQEVANKFNIVVHIAKQEKS